jgi:Cu(I)/Ag(I) efflux system membrane protein CusA/SilA
LDGLLYFFLTNKVIVVLLIAFITLWGIRVAPFDWDIVWMPRDPVPVDAIPDIGENQQIVFTEWPGRSPQDVEDQITYPLTVSLLGLPGVKTIRSTSVFGFSSIFIIFDEQTEFYWSRSRILEKLNSLPTGTLPDEVKPALGPDATALGQVFWYTLEGHDPDGNPIGGWDLQELRTVQDWYVRYALLAAEGVSEVASVGGFVQEYQIDVDPDAMRANDVSLNEVFAAVRHSNVDVGARTIEVNKVEYVIRGRGLIEEIEDIEKTVIHVEDGVPISIRDVGRVTLGPALRRGALDKAGAETVGGVVVVRHGANPLAVIDNVKEAMAGAASGLPAKAIVRGEIARDELEAFARDHEFEAYEGATLNHEAWVAWMQGAGREAWPAWLTMSQVTIVPFYDRTGLIHETLGTLSDALTNEVLITVLVVMLMIFHLRMSFIVSLMVPLAVLLVFIPMKYVGVDANIVALSGIAIAIGTIVDMSIIVTENIQRHRRSLASEASSLQAVFDAVREVAGAVITAVATTVIGFIPVFAMTGAEGKLFRPLAFTKTFALIASVALALLIVPALMHALAGRSGRWKRVQPPVAVSRIVMVAVVLMVGWLLADFWSPLGIGKGRLINAGFVAVLVGGTLLGFHLFHRAYVPLLRWCLDHKLVYLSTSTLFVLFGLSAWLGVERFTGFMPETIREAGPMRALKAHFPGMGKEFMPPLDEGSYLFMPSTMPHASIGEALDVLQYQDRAMAAIPEVESVVGKLGRAESPLDPAPISMFETVVNYKPEFISGEDGRPLRFQYDAAKNDFVRDADGELIEDDRGMPYRQWRNHIKEPDDIWDEMVANTAIPGTPPAPRLQPIAARLVMLQSGIRAPMGIKVRGPDLATIERVGLDLERLLKEVPGVEPEVVAADRIVGKPYLEIDINRDAIARYGLHVQHVQDVIEVAIGGRRITTTIEGRERYGVRVRYFRELRDDIESLDRIIVPAPTGAQVPLVQLADIRYVRGPQSIKSEDTFLVGYVVFDKKPGFAEVDVVEQCQAYLDAKIEAGELIIPAGVSYSFTGSYENQVRSQRTLAIVLPAALVAIFMVLYLQFRKVSTSLIVFSSILIAWSGGFIMLWLSGQSGFLDISVLDTSARELFQIRGFNLSVAVWVGFLALFGIASDDGVVMATYLEQRFAKRPPRGVQEIREATIEGAAKRIHPCLMTSATTILALLPVLTSTGRGADIMVPMALPTFGGMIAVLLSVFAIPVLYALLKEWSSDATSTSEGATS